VIREAVEDAGVLEGTLDEEDVAEVEDEKAEVPEEEEGLMPVTLNVPVFVPETEVVLSVRAEFWPGKVRSGRGTPALSHAVVIPRRRKKQNK